MKNLKIKQGVCLTILIVSLLFAGVASASDSFVPHFDDQVVFFGTFTLDSGETLEGNLVVFGGVVNLETDSVVTGDVVIFGGNVTAEGVINKNLVAIGGVAALTDTAIVHGDLIAPATVVRRADGAVVFGQIITENIPEIDIPEIPDIPEPGTPPTPSREPTFFDNVSQALRPVVSFFGALARALVFSAVAVLIFLVVPKHGHRVSQAIEEYPVLSGGFGLLSVAVFTAAVVVLSLLSITVILIPLTVPAIILLSLALVLGLVFGLIAVGADVGRRMMTAFKASWSSTLQVAIGSFSLSFVLGLLSIGLWSFFGGLLWTVVGAVGLGSVLLTRFGSRRYVSAKTPATGEPEALPEVLEAVSGEEEAPPMEEDSEEDSETEEDSAQEGDETQE